MKTATIIVLAFASASFSQTVPYDPCDDGHHPTPVGPPAPSIPYGPPEIVLDCDRIPAGACIVEVPFDLTWPRPVTDFYRALFRQWAECARLVDIRSWIAWSECCDFGPTPDGVDDCLWSVYAWRTLECDDCAAEFWRKVRESEDHYPPDLPRPVWPGDLDDASAFEWLVDLWITSEDDEIRDAAAEALGVTKG